MDVRGSREEDAEPLAVTGKRHPRRATGMRRTPQGMGRQERTEPALASQRDRKIRHGVGFGGRGGLFLADQFLDPLREIQVQHVDADDKTIKRSGMERPHAPSEILRPLQPLFLAQLLRLRACLLLKSPMRSLNDRLSER